MSLANLGTTIVVVGLVIVGLGVLFGGSLELIGLIIVAVGGVLGIYARVRRPTE